MFGEIQFGLVRNGLNVTKLLKSEREKNLFTIKWSIF